MESYKGYKILINDYNYGHCENVNFVFYNTNDCDEPGGAGSDIENCKIQIDYLVN
jgi:hypothetical protein